MAEQGAKGRSVFGRDDRLADHPAKSGVYLTVYRFATPHFEPLSNAVVPSEVVFRRPVKFSPRFAMLLLLLHMMVATIVYVTTMPLEARLAMLLLILLSLIYFLARDVFLLLPDSWCEISLDQGGVAIVTRDASKLLGRLANETTVSSYFVVLRVKLEGHHLPVSRVIFPDAFGDGGFREFCVRLKFA